MINFEDNEIVELYLSNNKSLIMKDTYKTVDTYLGKLAQKYNCGIFRCWESEDLKTRYVDVEIAVYEIRKLN